MTDKQMANLRELEYQIRLNSARVEAQLYAAGRQPEPAMVRAIAKYYETLKRLARD